MTDFLGAVALSAVAVTFSSVVFQFFSKTIGADMLNLSNNKKLSFSDVPRRLVGMLTYDLPVGKGGMLALPNRGWRALLGGWQIGSVFTFQSGFPLGPNSASTGSLNSLPNLTPDQPLVLPKSLEGWYNGSASVTLPDGRKYTPCAQRYLKYNPDAFGGEVVSTPQWQFRYQCSPGWKTPQSTKERCAALDGIMWI